MTQHKESLPPFLTEPSRVGDEVSVTGKWQPSKRGGLFRKSAEAKEMLREWEAIHVGATADVGVLSTEINHAVGDDAVLVHQVFEDADALVRFFSAPRLGSLMRVANPDLHIVRGVTVPASARHALAAMNVPAASGEFLFGYVREDSAPPEDERAIMVTAKWTCRPGAVSQLDDLEHRWQLVGTDAFSIEKGLLRFEVYRVVGEDALIIHETFENSNELKFHLSKGTAQKYKKDIDKVAIPEGYFFRGPVSWTIRTYSKFLHLPATYSRQATN